MEQDRHEHERIENERHEHERRERVRIENERHEREMQRRPFESRKHWRERQWDEVNAMKERYIISCMIDGNDLLREKLHPYGSAALSFGRLISTNNQQENSPEGRTLIPIELFT